MIVLYSVRLGGLYRLDMGWGFAQRGQGIALDGSKVEVVGCDARTARSAERLQVRRTEATEALKVGESRKLMRIDKEDASE